MWSVSQGREGEDRGRAFKCSVKRKVHSGQHTDVLTQESLWHHSSVLLQWADLIVTWHNTPPLVSSLHSIFLWGIRDTSALMVHVQNTLMNRDTTLCGEYWLMSCRRCHTVNARGESLETSWHFEPKQRQKQCIYSLTFNRFQANGQDKLM